MSIKIDHAAQAAYEEYLEEQAVEHREATLRGDFAASLEQYNEQVAVIAAVQPLSPLEQKLVDETVRLIESDERHLRQLFPSVSVSKLVEYSNQMTDEELLAHASRLCVGGDHPILVRRREVLDGFDPDRKQAVCTVEEYRKLVYTIRPLTIDEHREFSLKLCIIEDIEQNA